MDELTPFTVGLLSILNRTRVGLSLSILFSPFSTWNMKIKISVQTLDILDVIC